MAVLERMGGRARPRNGVPPETYLIRFPRMLRVSSLVRVLVALRVALVTAFLVVEVLDEDFLPVMASAAAAAATPVKAVRTLFSTLEAMLFLAFLARSFSSFSFSLAARAQPAFRLPRRPQSRPSGVLPPGWRQ